MVDEADRVAVGALLGRQPLGAFEVVVRDESGAPVVIRNAPLLDDGTPMPTRWWLVGPTEVLAVSRLESSGGVRRAESELDATAIADAHRRYAAERDAALPAGATVVPSGGVGGTRQGVKCLHAHYAWHLAGGDDPVGRWVAARLTERLDVDVAANSTLFSHAGHDTRIPVGPASLLVTDLVDVDPPSPAQLTNAIGRVSDHVDDVVRSSPGIGDATDVHVSGRRAVAPRRGRAGRRARGSERRRRARGGRGRVPGAGDRAPRRPARQSRARSGTRRHGARHVLCRRRGDAPAATAAAHVRGIDRLMARHPSAGARQPDPLRLYGRRVVLRPLAPADFPEWSEVRRRNEEWLTPWEPRRPPKQLDPSLHRDAFVARCTSRDRDSAAGVAYGFGVFVDNRLAGEVNLNSVLRGAMQSATVGYWIDQARAGQSLIAESVVVVAAFAFEQLDLHRLEICIVPRNRNSRRVMEKLDLREEGIARRFLEINGVWEDHVRYGFTVEEWTDRRDELTQTWL